MNDDGENVENDDDENVISANLPKTNEVSETAESESTWASTCNPYFWVTPKPQ